MKNVSIALTILFISAPMVAGLRFNANTDKFYSSKASNIDQNEYNGLMEELTDEFPQGLIYLTERERAAIFVMLKMRKSPASRQLSVDLKKLFKDLKKKY